MMRIFILAILFTSVSYSKVLYQPMLTSRSLGMGGTGTSLVRGVDALFMNPAALSRVEGYAFTIADVQVAAGTNSQRLVDQSQNSGGTLTASDLNDLYGETFFSDVSAKTGMVIPHFGFSFYSSNYLMETFNDPVFPTFNVDFVSDYGYLIAAAIPLSSQTSIGISGRHVKRWEAKQEILVTDLIGTTDTDLIESLANNKGTGNALDLSLLTTWSGPYKPTLGLFWKDIGHTKFSATSGEGPQQQEDNLIAGFSMQNEFLLADWTHAIEYKFIRTENEDFSKKIHFGTEASYGILDLRAGFSQGYLSYGLALDFSFIKIEAASYTVELGRTGGQSRSDRYQASISLNLDFDQAFKLQKDGKKRRLMQRR